MTAAISGRHRVAPRGKGLHKGAPRLCREGAKNNGAAFAAKNNTPPASSPTTFRLRLQFHGSWWVRPKCPLATDAIRRRTCPLVRLPNFGQKTPTLEIDTSDGIKVDGAKVVRADIRASNGVIHVIDTVIMPH